MSRRLRRKVRRDARALICSGVELTTTGWTGFNVVDADYTSDFQKYSSEQRRQTDLKRNLYIDLLVRNELKIELYTKGVNSLGQGCKSLWLASSLTLAHRCVYRELFQFGFRVDARSNG